MLGPTWDWAPGRVPGAEAHPRGTPWGAVSSMAGFREQTRCPGSVCAVRSHGVDVSTQLIGPQSSPRVDSMGWPRSSRRTVSTVSTGLRCDSPEARGCRPHRPMRPSGVRVPRVPAAAFHHGRLHCAGVRKAGPLGLREHNCPRPRWAQTHAGQRRRDSLGPTG